MRSFRRGQALTLVALLLPVLFVAMGLGVDSGVAADQFRTDRNAADAAALAAAFRITRGDSESQAAIVADAVATNDGVVTAGGSLSGGIWTASPMTLVFEDGSGLATTDPTQVTQVRASVANSTPTVFMRLAGIPTARVGTSAVAAFTPASSSSGPCSLCVLDPNPDSSLRLSGNVTVTVTNGAIGVDSPAGTAIDASGTGTVASSATMVVGGAATSSFTFTPTPHTGSSPIPDPFAALQPPTPTDIGPSRGNVRVTGSQTLQPGIYGSITVPGGGVATLAPGNYVITTQLVVQGSIQGSGVFIYLACWNYPTPCSSPWEAGAQLNFAGTAGYDLTAPTSGPYRGVVIFADRNNEGGINLAGSGQDLSGSIYARNQNEVVAMSGAVGQTATLDSVIAAGQVWLAGDGTINLDGSSGGGGSTGRSLPALTG